MDNRQGGFYAFNFTTGLYIKRRSTTPLPTPQRVIDKVTQLAELQNAPEGLIFGDRTNALCLDDPVTDLNNDSDSDDRYASDPDYSDHPSENDDNESQIIGVTDDDGEFLDSQ